MNKKKNIISLNLTDNSLENKALNIERAIRLTWESLESHLPATHGELEAWAKKRGESHQFHKDCVRDYAETILLLTSLY